MRKIITAIRIKLLAWLSGVDFNTAMSRTMQFGSEQFDLGFKAGKAQSKIHMRVIPLPFTPEQLTGTNYGEFITPVGWACDAFGECNVPAPSVHGYEQRAYYVSREQLQYGGDLVCNSAHKFQNPADSPELVPVIVTVLR